jgi:hypothetical protein
VQQAAWLLGIMGKIVWHHGQGGVMQMFVIVMLLWLKLHLRKQKAVGGGTVEDEGCGGV